MITDEYRFVAAGAAGIVLFSSCVRYEGLRIMTDHLPGADTSDRRRGRLCVQRDGQGLARR